VRGIEAERLLASLLFKRSGCPRARAGGHDNVNPKAAF